MGRILLAFACGLAFGSFLNVVWTRLPRGESVVHPGSHCRSCGRMLAWHDNIPVVSWVLLRGRCRRCGSRIPVRYALVELGAGLAAAAAAGLLLRLPEPEAGRG